MSKICPVLVPKWGIEMSKGTLVQWLKEVGDTVSKGDEVFEMESSKAVNVWEAPADGVLRLKLADAGESRPVGALLGVIAPADIDENEIEAFIAKEAANNGDGAQAVSPQVEEDSRQSDAVPSELQQAGRTPIQAVATGETLVPEILTQGQDDSECRATPHARRFARRVGVNLHNISGSGRDGRISRQDVEQAILATGGRVETPKIVDRSSKGQLRSRADDSQVRATPVARRLAKTLHINLNDCRASGERGRVCKADVEAANALLNGAPATAAAIATGTITAEDTRPAVEEVPMSGMRQTIGARLQSSKQNAPHFRVTVDVILDKLLDLRKQINVATPSVKISVNDMVVKACAMALVKVPDINVQYDEAAGVIRRFKDADIACAVALESGLITPIVKAANTKSLSAISSEMRNLVTKAKAGTLIPEEFQGGSFTISNLGMFRVKQFDAIINPPQAAILAVGCGEQRPVVARGELTVATVMTLSLSSDHRVIDGEPAAQFLQHLKQFIENPSLMLV